jgi:hypothetical protein
MVTEAKVYTRDFARISCSGILESPNSNDSRSSSGKSSCVSSSRTKGTSMGWSKCGHSPRASSSSRFPSCPNLKITDSSGAAEAGLKLSKASIQAQTFPAAVICETNDNATVVLPEHSVPTNSVTDPIGNPPCARRSRASIPVGTCLNVIRSSGG